MESVLENSLLDSPLFDFIGRNWRRWEKGICAVDLQERDLMLYLMWGLDFGGILYYNYTISKFFAFFFLFLL